MREHPCAAAPLAIAALGPGIVYNVPHVVGPVLKVLTRIPHNVRYKSIQLARQSTIIGAYTRTIGTSLLWKVLDTNCATLLPVIR